MTYNLRGGLGAEGEWDFRRLLSGETVERIATVIRAADPDIVALQEVIRATFVGQAFDLLGELSARLGMDAAFGEVTPIKEGSWGNAVLSRWPICCARTFPLVHREDDDPRGTIEAQVRVGDDSVALYSVHLSYREPETASQARQLLEIVQPALAAGPVILAGDFNAAAESPALAALRADFKDAFTLSGVPPGDRRRASYPVGPRRHLSLDQIFVSAEFTVERCWVVEDHSGASDHNPVIADLTLAPRRAAPPVVSAGAAGRDR